MQKGEESKISRRHFVSRGLCAVSGMCLPAGVMAAAGGGADLPSTKIKARYFTHTPRGIKCDLCPNNCILETGETGDCHSRVNDKGTLYSLSYGNPCAVHADPIEKKPLFHFYPGTKAYSIGFYGCNMACMNCQNWQISQKGPEEKQTLRLMPQDAVSQAIQQGCNAIAYTYTEPLTFYEYMYDTAQLARGQGLSNVLISNGYMHEKPLLDLIPYLDAANIDLKSFSNNIYIKLNAGTIRPVLNTLLALKKAGVWLEITNLLIPGWTDNAEMIGAMCRWLVKEGFADTPMHFSRFFPAYKLKHVSPTPTETVQQARTIALEAGMRYVYTGNVQGGEGGNTLCSHCQEQLIRRAGYRVEANRITHGACPRCHTIVPGRF